MLGNGLTLSTDNGEQAGEENDRMAPHHLFSPSLPPRGFFRPAIGRPSSSSSVFHVRCRTRVERSALLTRPKREHTIAITPILLLLLVVLVAAGPSRVAVCVDHSMVFPPNRSRLDRRLTSRKIPHSALISLLSPPLLLREEPTGRRESDRVSARTSFRDEKKTRFTYASHVIRSLMTADRSRDHQ